MLFSLPYRSLNVTDTLEVRKYDNHWFLHYTFHWIFILPSTVGLLAILHSPCLSIWPSITLLFSSHFSNFYSLEIVYACQRMEVLWYTDRCLSFHLSVCPSTLCRVTYVRFNLYNLYTTYKLRWRNLSFNFKIFGFVTFTQGIFYKLLTCSSSPILIFFKLYITVGYRWKLTLLWILQFSSLSFQNLR